MRIFHFINWGIKPDFNLSDKLSIRFVNFMTFITMSIIFIRMTIFGYAFTPTSNLERCIRLLLYFSVFALNWCHRHFAAKILFISIINFGVIFSSIKSGYSLPYFWSSFFILLIPGYVFNTLTKKNIIALIYSYALTLFGVFIQIFPYGDKTKYLYRIPLPYLESQNHQFVLFFVVFVMVMTFCLSIYSIYSNREIQKSLKRSYQRYQTIFGHMVNGFIVHDKIGRIIEYNPRALQLLQISEKDIKNKDIQAIFKYSISAVNEQIPTEDVPPLQAMKNESNVLNKVIGLKKNSGAETTWFNVSSTTVKDLDNEDDQFIITSFHDITEDKKHQEERDANSERLLLAMKSVKFGIWDWDIVANSIYWDDSMDSIYGLSFGEFAPQPDEFYNYLIPEDRNRVKQEMENCLKERKDFETEFTIIRKDGEKRTIKSSSKTYYNSKNEAERMIGVNWDITEEKERKLKLIQSAKMSTLGEMSSGIAHEINNPLAIISGASQILRIQINNKNADASMKLIDSIEKTVMRISKIIKGLKNFARDGDLDPFEEASLKAIMDETLSFCQQRFLNHNIKLFLPEIDESITIECRPVQISQVFLNLLNNAFEAVEGRNDKWIKIEVQNEKNRVLIKFSDSGPGVPEEIVSKIMHPFFSTKSHKGGTGLGLSISQDLVKDHSGELYVDQLNGVTTFVVVLPHKLQLK